MTAKILDASAMIAYLSGEPGGDIVKDLIEGDISLCYAHSINICEVFYDSLRKTDIRQARTTLIDLYAAGVVKRDDLSRGFIERIGLLKQEGAYRLRTAAVLLSLNNLAGSL